MEIYVATVMDFDYEVIDVVMVIDNRICWIKGFNDDEWEKSNEYANKLATRLSIEFVGEIIPDDLTPEDMTEDD